MNKEFTTYEQALALKELGFDEPCLAYYFHSEFSYWIMNSGSEYKHCANEYFNNNEVSALLYQQAFRWFREKHNLQTEMVFSEKPDRFYYYIGNMVTGDMDRGDDMSYEEAESACLDVLIEIVKSK